MHPNRVNLYIQTILMLHTCLFYILSLFFSYRTWQILCFLCITIGWNMIYFIPYTNKKKTGTLIGFYGFASVLYITAYTTLSWSITSHIAFFVFLIAMGSTVLYRELLKRKTTV
ncbi:hypothetical protein ACS4JF_30195 [Bacillus thuringiensis]|uniref:hypothetical protein n=1 Tax=Bacillus thuringiensis TaxID=1428 RepID=UPI001FABBC60